MERVCRLAGHRVPKGHALTESAPLTSEGALEWGRYAANSPFYQHLNEVVANDAALLSILNSIEHSPRQNILFAGVQYLMMRDGGGDLGAYYPNFTAEPLDMSGVEKPFRSFVLGHFDELVEIGRERYTQTNECRRCVALLPTVWATGMERFHLVDLGTSAGLNLHMDRYRYRWGETTWGPDSPVHLTTDNRGVDVSPRHIEILSRTGLDLNPIDPLDADSRRWLEALVWPEHHDRLERLRSALEIAAANPVDLIAGNGLATLPAILQGVPDGDPVVVVNSFTLGQFDPEDRARLDDLLRVARASRPVYRVSMEWLDPDAEGADLAIDDGSELEKIGSAHPHGEWLDLFTRA